MENILQVTNNQVTISTLVIAEHTEKEHKNLRELIEDNISDFNEFGILEAIIEKPNKGSRGGKPTKLYLLNEQQYSLLMTFLRNNPKVKEFKKNMVKAFFEMKKQLENKSSNNDLQKILDTLEKQNQEIQNLKNQLILKEQEEVNPFKGFYDNFKPRKRENEFAYTRKDWMLLLSECERVLVQERQSKRQLLLTRGAL
ncbi:MAG: Rha family transcriptional regulator [Arcobacter sp.]|nr:Rha family transcriptional regulator [Arcobacter sp.]